MADFHSKMSACRHELGVQPPNPPTFQPCMTPKNTFNRCNSQFSKHSHLFYTQYFTALFDTRYDTFSHSAVADCHVYFYFVQSCWHSFSRIICDWCQDRTWNLGTDETSSLTSDFTYAIDVTVPWSVCLSRSCIVLKRQKISTPFLPHTTDQSLSQILLKFCLHWSIASPQIVPQIPPPLLIWASAIFDGKLVIWLAVAQWSQWRAYRKPPSLFRMVPPLTP